MPKLLAIKVMANFPPRSIGATGYPASPGNTRPSIILPGINFGTQPLDTPISTSSTILPIPSQGNNNLNRGPTFGSIIPLSPINPLPSNTIIPPRNIIPSGTPYQSVGSPISPLNLSSPLSDERVSGLQMSGRTSQLPMGSISPITIPFNISKLNNGSPSMLTNQLGGIESTAPTTPINTIQSDGDMQTTTTPKKGRKGREPTPSQLYGIVYNYIIQSIPNIPPEVINIIRSLALTRRSEQGNFKIGNNEGSLFYQDLPPKGKGRAKSAKGKTYELSTNYTVQDMNDPMILSRFATNVINFIRKYASIIDVTGPSRSNMDLGWSIFSRTMQSVDLLRQFYIQKLDEYDAYTLDRLVSQTKLLMITGVITDANVTLGRNPDSSVEIRQINNITLVRNQTTGEINVVVNNAPTEPTINPEQAVLMRDASIAEAGVGLLESNSYYLVPGVKERSISTFIKMSAQYGEKQI